MANQLDFKLGSNTEEGTILNQCYLCKAWALEKNLKPIEIPDQGAGYVRKLACLKCLNIIMGTERDNH